MEHDIDCPRHVRPCSRAATLAVLLSLQLGWGLWLMPHVFASFGWISALVILVVSAATGISGSLFGELCDAVPDAQTLEQIGSKAYQRTGRRLAASFVGVTKLAVCLLLQLAAATALQHALMGVVSWGGDGVLPLWVAQAIVGCAVLLAVQLRHLEHLSWFCYIGNAAQLAAAVLMCAGLWGRCSTGSCDAGHRAPTCIVETGSHSWTHQVVTILSIFFAFGGQYAFVDVVHHMTDRKAFSRVQQLATCIMAALYIAFGTAVYAAEGSAAMELEVFNVHGPPALARTVVVCVLLQTFVQHALSVHLWTGTFMRLCAAGSEPCVLPRTHLVAANASPAIPAAAGGTANAQVTPDCLTAVPCQGVAMSHVPACLSGVWSVLGQQSARMGRMWWLLASAASIVLCGIVSTVVPSLQHLVGIVAAATYIMLAYGLPSLFGVVLLEGRHGLFFIRTLTAVFVVSVLVSPFGVAASVLSFVQSST